MNNTVREALARVHWGLLATCLVLVTACEADPNGEPDDAVEETAAEAPAERIEAVDHDDWRVASRADSDGVAAHDEDHARFRDFSDAMHATFAIAARARDSEMGHEAYRPELHEDFMAEGARTWLALMQETQARFSDGIAMHPEATRESEGDWEVKGIPGISDLPWGVYAYHMHHRNEWFAHHDLADAITHNPLGYLTGLSRHVFEGFLEDGVFHHDTELEEHDLDSMMAGHAAAHAMAYAWIRWDKPGGEDDMGRVPADQLAGWLGKDPEALLQFGREAGQWLDEAWDEDYGIYRPDGEDVVALKTLGKLLRGHKALYESLYVFGDDDDAELAETLFKRAADLAEAVVSLEQDWGLPARIRFTEDGAEAGSEIVDTTAQWDYIAHLTAGFSFLREREGTARMLARKRPELADELDEFVDRQIIAALDYQMPDGILIRELELADGEPRDAGHALAGISRFLLGAGEGYGGSDRFATPGNWDDVEHETVERTRALYATLLEHGDFVKEVLIRAPTE